MDDYSNYLKSDHWKIMREKRLSIDNYKCQLCGTKKDLRVHHLRYNDLDNVDTLLTVCDKCHRDIHEFREVVSESSKNGRLRDCMDAYDIEMTNIMDSFVLRREKTLNDDGDALFMTGGHSGRMNKYINALLHAHPYGDVIGMYQRHNCGIGYTRYNNMRLARKRKK